ncbi:MAG TPA: hypothetical protein VKM54_10180 [Myxococcota bacterium]|nr:hypothetical protein [Myxococcota bacterium]
MPPSEASRASSEEAPASRFVLYVEGPSDREILRSWAWRVAPELARALVQAAVILGGRQPARAADHFRAIRSECVAARALCVLDRDGSAPSLPPTDSTEPGLEFFTWGRRHIESYLLVPDAIVRAAGFATEHARQTRLVRRHLPPLHDESALREIHAKALLAEGGPLSRALGRPLSPAHIARQMDRHDLHPDVLDLLGRVAAGLEGASGGERAVFPCPPTRYKSKGVS